jgi:hypothetical protein
MFEAPASYEASPYGNPEWEGEWESYEYGQSPANPELTSEWELPEMNSYANPELTSEWELPETNPYANPELTSEWELPETNPYANPEYEYEGDPEFFKKLRGFVRKVAAPLAKRFAPTLARTLGGMIPGVGAIAGPLAASLTSQLLKEGEMEAVQMETAAFGSNEMEAEVANTEAAYEAALTEVLASQAAEATSQGEAEALLGATLPITITIMGGRRSLRRVMPSLAKANSVLVQSLRQQGTAGKQLLRTVPSIQRQTVSTLKAAARAGQPINSATAVKAMAASTRRVLGNPQRVEQVVTRNAVLRQRTVPPNPRRAMASSCPSCRGR